MSTKIALPDVPSVSARITLADVEARLTECAVPFRRLAVGVGAHIVVSSYGARVYGPFFDDGPSLSWLPDAFADPDRFAALHAGGAWNVGGDRVWIGPEIEYMIPDRTRYWDTYDMPPALDPGAHVLGGDVDEPTLHRHMRLRAHLTGGTTSVDLTLRVRPLGDPLLHLGGMPAEVSCAAYATELTLSSAGRPAPVEPWMLLQVHPGGTALVPGAPRMRVTDYYEPVGPLLSRVSGGTAVRITGADRFKLGFAAPHVTGRLGYLRSDGAGTATLLVRASPVHPGLDYAEEPDDRPGHRGDALHIYNDDGGLGGFAEMEARGTPALLGTDGTRRPLTDRFSTWWFRGPSDEVADIVRDLVHIDPADLDSDAEQGATA